MINELDVVVLSKDIPASRLKAGDIGTVVLVHGDGHAYEVEFMTIAGKTVALETITNDYLREVSPDDISHARPMAV